MSRRVYPAETPTRTPGSVLYPRYSTSIIRCGDIQTDPRSEVVIGGWRIVNHLSLHSESGAADLHPISKKRSFGATKPVAEGVG